ncbi:MAG: alpha/beta hydrolase-fold protein [Crocinitomicaceae bacterium]|nr:alpha/beta hydrolase-fold protein [Crocinitomicaceae bacterium]
MKLFLVAILLFVSINTAYSQSPIEVGQKYIVDSEVLGEEREVWVGLPPYYDSTVSYLVVYVMDAEWQFDITLATVKELASNDKIPVHIVVGIPHVDRERRFMDLTFTSNMIQTNGDVDSSLIAYFGEDLTGGGHTFYKHLVDEVMPFVAAKHKTNGFDVYIGHSLSGYFGAYLISMDSPFNAFQLYDASIWYDRGEAIKYTKEHLNSAYRTNVYLSSANGGREREQNNIDTHAEFNELLKSQGINSENVVYNDEGHGSVRLPSLIDGLSKLYEGFSIGFIFPTDKITVATAKKHYADFSKKVNYEFTCPVDAFRWVGHANHAQENWTEAIKAYELCKALFVDDPRFQLEAAESYFEVKDFVKSMDHYERLLYLDANNEPAKLRLQELADLIEGH